MLIFELSSDNEHFNGDLDYAAINLTPKLMEKIERRVAFVQAAREADPQFGAADYDGWFEVLSYEDELSELTDPITGDDTYGRGVFRPYSQAALRQYLDKTYENGDAPRAEGHVMHVAHHGIYWEALPKHGGCRVSTAMFSLDELRKLAELNETEA